jgi:hypothetical protein
MTSDARLLPVSPCVFSDYSHSSEAVALKGKHVSVRHPVKGMPVINGVLSLEPNTSRVLVNGVGG